jgi:misacylated tRNA(Ala) deacylase
MAPHTHARTERLELADQSLREWSAVVLASDRETGIVLDRSAFYPGGGGQPPDHGVLLWGGVQTRIVGARSGDDVYLVAHDDDPLPPVGTHVQGALDDVRRTTLMRTHSALHLLSGVVYRDFGALVTGGNMEPGEARMDFGLPDVPVDFKDRVAAACAAEVAADRAIRVENLPREEAFAIPTSSARRRTCCRPTSRWCASSTSSASTPRPTAERTSRRPARSAASRSSRSRARARGSGGCGCASPTGDRDQASRAVATPLQRRSSAARSSGSTGAACSCAPHSSRGSIHITSNSLPSGSAP